MRKSMVAFGLAMALTAGSAALAAAQGTEGARQRPEQHQQRGERAGARGERGGPGALLHGITLSDAQKAQLKQYRDAQRAKFASERGQFREEMQKARDERQHGDSAAARQLEELEDPHSSLSQLWDQEHDQHILAQLMKRIEPEFPLAWWHAFRRHVVEGARASAVAKELGVSVNVVLLAKSRILRRLRQEAAGFVD